MADKLKMQTENIADKNFEMLSKMFPNALTETITGYDDDGKPIVERAIDADVLRQEISCKVVEGKDERYQFTWPDKKKAVLLANTPLNKTLCPSIRESINFDTTDNIFIEGDNLDALKLIQETYLEKIKIIYIDPPYNTGNDFVYDDSFKENINEYLENSGQYDENGNQLVKNIESNGRFHTDWINMMYSRLRLARNLLRDDGAIFISIDDNEVKNMRNICDEIFGESNFVNHIIWHKKYGAANDAKYLSDVHEHILLYCKNKAVWHPNLFERPDELNAKYKNPDNDPRGPWVATNLSVKTYSAANDYIITSPAGLQFSPPPSRCWVVSKEKYEEMLADNRITFGKDGLSRPYKKTFLSEVQNGVVPTTIWSYDDAGHTIGAKSEIRDLFSDTKAPFDTPKPTKLIKRIISMSESNTHDDIILDFFGGSGTTADAVMQLNAEDNGNRKYIIVQMKEETQQKSVARLVGFESISQICKERIRRAAQKIADENPEAKFDGGFRVLKCDSSNMKDVYYNPSETQQSLFDTYADNIKEDRTPEDLLFQVMLDLGVLLSSKIEETTIAGKQVFNVADGFLIACFDNDVTEETVKAVAEKKPYYAVFRDSSMANDSVATNFDQIFASISPDTVRKVL